MKKSLLFFTLIILVCGCTNNDDGIPDIDVIVPNNPPNEETENTQGNFVPCENGLAGAYPCNGYDLLGRLSLNALNASSGNDIWGWTDNSSSREFALVGLNNGTAFVEITDTENLVYLGKLPTATTSSSWRDIKVYADFAFVGAEAGGHGMQVFDLKKLLSVSNPPVTFSADTRYTGFGNSHNIVINEATGFAYAVGTDTYSGGTHIIDIQNPFDPVAAGGYGDSGYTHDAQVVLYNGPDADYTGREIFIGANEDRVVVIDVSDKNNPIEISSFQYSNVWYTHQGWFTEDQRYFILGDELDEINFGFNSRTLVFDLLDLDAPVLLTTYLGSTAAIDHNGYVKGNTYYLSNYTAGMRVLDISGIESGTIAEVGYFDSYPSSNSASFNGVWSVYPYFDSGKIILNDINSGFFVIEASN